MSDNNLLLKRRDLLASAGRLSIASTVAPALASAALSAPAEAPSASPAEAAETQTEATAEKVVDALQGAYGLHPGQRRNHTKGVGARGRFVGNPEVAAYSRSALFAGETLEVVARFSLAGGDPEASDAEKSPRGMALEFRQEKVTLVKFRFVPQDGEKQLTDAELASAPRDFLEQALMERLAKGPARWDMILTIGEPGDEETNPTILWPKNRKELKAGTLELTSATPSMEAGSNKINYDPMVMQDGIEPTDDPVLLFRSPSYGTSYTRRLRGL
jgi:catalase